LPNSRGGAPKCSDTARLFFVNGLSWEFEFGSLELKVTALKQQTRDKNRVNVYLDGEFAFGLAKILALPLRLKQDLTDADIERLQAADAEEQAYERALKFIAVRPRSESEVRLRLRKHEVPPVAIDAVLERLKRAGLLDDEAFAKYWVENRAAFRPRSKRMLQMELRRKGVTAEALDEALEQTDDAEAACALALKRAQRLRGLPEPDFRRKLSEYLARRGFSYDTVEPVVRQIWNDIKTDHDTTTD
jgi:regulatory protein